jgi:hypothetical protein
VLSEISGSLKNKFRPRYAYAFLVKSMSYKMFLEMCRSFLTNHLQPKAHDKIDWENMHKVKQELKTSKPRRETR